MNLYLIRGFPGSPDLQFELHDNVTKEEEEHSVNQLKVFYRDGKFLSRVTLDEIRARSV
ncbi:putative nicotinamide phosphoribosyltransferase [Pseudomonas phage 16Q]|nr:putative nicotinamide phosphoribosyltransferase [Pseudomonas phage 16Q]